MPIIKSAAKRVRQANQRRAQNRAAKQNVKIAIRRFTDKPSLDRLTEAQRALDTAVKKRVMHKTTASRRKSQLAATAKQAGVKPAAKKASSTKRKSTNTASKPAASKQAPAKTASKKSATTAGKSTAASKTKSTASKTGASKSSASKSSSTKKSTKQ